MFRMFEITESLEPPYTVVCNDDAGGDTYMEDFFLSKHPTDVERYAMLYDNVKDLMVDAQMLQNILPSTDIGIQALGANGNWYLYDYNKQIESVQALVNMK